MADPIVDKTVMYRKLAAGELGNIVPQFFDRGSWSRFVGENVDRFPMWGLRSTVGSGDPRSRLNVTTPGVYRLLDEWYPDGRGFNLSPMIQQYAQLNAQIAADDEPVLEWIDPTRRREWVDASHPWRYGFRFCRRETRSPTAIKLILDAYLNEPAREQFDRLMADYPRHVIEFTVCDRACGVEPVNNMIVWEVRRY